MSKRLLIATGNVGKAKELGAALEGLQVETLKDHPLLEMPPETGETFRENALAKAIYAHRATGLPTLADDSGLVVDALNGQPGVRSARYVDGSDRDRYLHLLNVMQRIPDEARAARFVCAMAFVADGVERVVEGRCEGRIGRTAAGEGGFGYDPVFHPDEAEGTMAQIALAAKNRISHRGHALNQMLSELQGHFLLE